MSAEQQRSGDAEPLIVYRLRGGAPPPDDEQLAVESDGTFSLWRTRATATRPPTCVGRFEGRLTGNTIGELRSIVERCRSSPPIDRPFAPGASIESYVLGVLEHRAAADDPMDGPWGELAKRVRALAVSLTEHPVAGLALDVDAGRWRLARLGVQELRMDLSRARVRVVRWDGDVPVEVQAGVVSGPRDLMTTAGWTHDLGELVVAGDHPHSVTVDDVLLHDGGFWHSACLYVRVERAGDSPR